MALQHHINGEAKLQTGTGSAQALESLGVSMDGVTIEITDHIVPYFTDSFGPKVPFDEAHLMQTARISCRLVWYDETVYASIRPMFFDGTEGTMAQTGSLFGANSKYFRLLILSPGSSLPWNFLKARIDGMKRVKVSVLRNEWDISFFALPYTGTEGVTTSAVLYNRTTS